ncbi:MAG: sigma-70 family RNA polymerase sigma factor [Candidatus Poribacteria bacterium]|nr:sigma-70 family RNA polymerase sigma factor [Candidatus Poribacteria bacterium]
MYVQNTTEGDAEAFNALVQRHHAMIYGLAYRMLGNPDDAADATQESFLEAYKSVRSFQFQSKFSTWLYRVAINICQQYNRKSDSRGRTLTAYKMNVEEEERQYETNCPDRLLLKAEREGLVQAAIDQLPPKQRLVITLFYMQHMRYREIGELLNCPEGTVASRLNTAVQNLKSKLKDLYPE